MQKVLVFVHNIVQYPSVKQKCHDLEIRDADGGSMGSHNVTFHNETVVMSRKCLEFSFNVRKFAEVCDLIHSLSGWL